MIIITLLAFLYFTITNTSNAADVIETWDISANDGESHVTATLYSDGNMVISGTGRTDAYNYFAPPYASFRNDIKEITIEEGVRLYHIGDSIGYDIFKYCYNLEAINVSENNSEYKDNNGILFSKDETILIKYPPGRDHTNYTVPEGITKIASGAFEKCVNLTTIEIPNSVTTIGGSVFENCTSLTEINIPNSVKDIESRTFYKCKNLSQIQLPDSVTKIGDYAFYECTSLTEIEIPNSVTKIETYAFESCENLTNINIPDGVTQIGWHAFSNCYSLVKIKIPDGVTKIDCNTFENCTALTSIEIPNSVTSIEKEAFIHCKSLTNIIIPEGVTEIANNIFKNSIYNISILPQATQIDLPYLLEKAINTNDMLYANENIEYNNCDISSDKTKLIINDNVYQNNEYASIKINEGKLAGLEIRFILSGTITYNYENWVHINVTAVLHLLDGEQVINNDEKISYVFNENGEFTFEYRDINGDIKEVVAKVENIDKEKPIIKKVEKYYDKENVVIRIEAEDSISGLHEKAYRFNEGRVWDKPWQESNEIIINNDENMVQVRDKASNIQTYEMPSLSIHEEGYKIIGENGTNYIEFIKPNTKYKELKEKISTKGILEIYKGNTKVTDGNEIIGTGMTVKVKLNDKEETFKTVVKGDVTGDGLLKMADLLKLARYKAGIDTNLEGAYLRAGDVVKDEKIGMPDILKLSRVLAGIENL